MKKEYLSSLLLAFLCTFFMATGQILWKISADNNSGIWIFLSLYGILGTLSYLVALIPFTYALKILDLSVIFPVVAINYVWIAIASSYFLNELMNSYKWLGIFAIIIGVSFVGRGSKK